MIPLSEIKQFFEEYQFYPEYKSGCELINDPEKFVKSHISYLEANSGNPGYLPYYDRLLKYYNFTLTQLKTK